MHPPPPQRKKQTKKQRKNLTHRKRGYLNKDFFLQLIHKIIISTSKLALFSFKFIWTWCKRVDIHYSSSEIDLSHLFEANRLFIFEFQPFHNGMIEMLSLAYYVFGQIKDYSLLCQTSFQNMSLHTC